MMNGLPIPSVGVSGVADNDWQIKEVGDFDGDGKTDICGSTPLGGQSPSGS
jgi:hypothetical protein